MIIFSSMQLNDTKIQEIGRNEGIKSLLHCQDTFLPYLNFIQIQSSDDQSKLPVSTMFVTSENRCYWQFRLI